MLVFLISEITNQDSRNTTLAQDILNEYGKDEVCVVFTFRGGSGKNEMVRMSDPNNYVVKIVPQLFNFNAFKGYQLFRDDIVEATSLQSLSSSRQQPTFVVLDNTCVLHKDFSMKMFWINNIKLSTTESSWVFAHTYGLYNMGIGNTLFMDEYCGAFEDVVTSITQEHAENVDVAKSDAYDDVRIRSLHEFSHHTLKKQTLTNTTFIDGVMSTDTFSVTGVEDADGVRKFMAYISAFGVFKFFRADSSYVFPVWASKSHEATSSDKVRQLKHMISSNKIECNLFPLVPYTQTV